jgi:hypothetical protein
MDFRISLLHVISASVIIPLQLLFCQVPKHLLGKGDEEHWYEKKFLKVKWFQRTTTKIGMLSNEGSQKVHKKSL